MFWTDIGSTHPVISRADMDGKHIVHIVHNVRHPNGITIDYQRERIYWTDSSLNKIQMCDYRGLNKRTIKYGYSILPYPYSISVYKVSVLIVVPLYKCEWSVSVLSCVFSI